MTIPFKTMILLLLSLSASSAKLRGGANGETISEKSNQRELFVYTDSANRPTKEVRSYGSSPPLVLGHCEGDCDFKEHCGPGLICFQRNAYEEVPGCNGGRTHDSQSDFCVKIDDFLLLEGKPPVQFVTGEPDEGSLGRCKGDCDTDDDCKDDLVCFQREDREEVPGCRGGLEDYSLTDYCVRKSDRSAGRLALDIGAGFLKVCQGDCDDDSDCDSGLVCHQRNENEPVPGCIGGENDSSRTDYCVAHDYRGNSRRQIIESSLDGGNSGRNLQSFHEKAVEWLIDADIWLPPVQEERPQELWRERYAMTALYFATEGDKWFDPRNYLSADSVCTWSGIGDEIEVHCNENGRVVSVIGRENGMLGTLPPALSALTMLRRIDFNGNNIRGSIPKALGQLTRLTRLDLYDNNLTGSIPTVLGDLSNLDQIALNHNGLTGTLPTTLNWINVRRFSITDNALSGSIPAIIGNWSNLYFLELSNNRFRGSLPNTIGHLSSLEHLYLSNNRLSGTIHPFIPRSLIHLDLRSNNLIGFLPSELGLISDIQTIDLAYNGIFGGFPSEIGQLTRLYDLNLRGNELLGSLPTELVNMDFLTDFDIGVNKLNGDVPPLPSYLTNCSFDNNSFDDTSNAEGICRLN